jgi:hypothetical protein
MPANDLDDDPPMRPKADMDLVPPVVAPPKLPPPKPPISSPPVNSVPASSTVSNTTPVSSTAMNSGVNNPAMANNNGQSSQFFQQMMMNQAANPQKEEHWVKSYWRPAMGWLYMLICLVDFVIFPALTMVLPAILKGFGITVAYTAWQSLSLQNGGFIHIAMAAILGVAAWTRGNEKVAKVNHPNT